MFFGNGYFRLNGDLRRVSRDGYSQFSGWWKKRSGRQWSEETSGRGGVDSRDNWGRGSPLEAGDLSIRGQHNGGYSGRWFL